MRKIKILIIEDDPTWSVFIESIFHESDFQVVGFANTFTKAEAMFEGLNPDILICDIMIDNQKIFKFLDEPKYRNFPIIFMTSHAEENNFDISQNYPKSIFLAKPFHKFTLLSTVNFIKDKLNISTKVIDENFIKFRGKQGQYLNITFENIIFIESEGNYCSFWVQGNRKYVKKIPLKKVMLDLDNRFVRVHKRYIINSGFIRRIDLGNKIVIVGEQNIPIGRGFRPQLEPILLSKE